MTRLRLELLATQVRLDVPAGDVEDMVMAIGGDLGAAMFREGTTGAELPFGLLTVRGEAGAWGVDVVGQVGLEDATGTGDDLTTVLLAAVTRGLVDASPLLGVHAGVFAAGEGLVVIPGGSGHGKTTLVAACLQAGFGYVSDEVLAVDRATGTVHAFPRPLALGHDVWPVLGLDIGIRPACGSERLVPLASLGVIGVPGPVRHVLLTHRRDGDPSLTPAPNAEAVPALLRSAFNHFRDPRGSLRAVIDMARGARTWHAGYQEAPELAETLRGAIGVPQPDRAMLRR